MAKSEKKIRAMKVTTTTEDQVHRVKQVKQHLKQKYRYRTGGSGRRFLLHFALLQLRHHGKRGTYKKASTKRVAVWTVINTSQETYSSSEDDYEEDEEVSEFGSEESYEQDGDSSDYENVEDTFVGLHLLLPTYILDNETRNGFKVTQNWTAADSFLEKEDMTRMQKIEALEMAAAIILTEPYYRSEIERAFGYWRRALYLRQMEPDLTQKTPLVLKSGQPGEWITSHQLEGILAHPSEYQIQSFLVRLRTCSSKSWGAVLSFLNDSFDECIYDLKMQGRLVDLLDVLWVTLETIQNHLFDYESDYENCLLVEKVICNLIWMLSQLNMDDPLLNAETFTLPLQVMVAADEEFAITDDDSDATENSNSYIQHVEPLYKLIVLLAGLPRKILTPQIRQSLRQLALGEYGTSLLHMACKDCNLPTIRLLLESKADPNAEDRNENVALHILADHYGDDEAIARAAQLLLERGAQLEIAIDRYGRTPADVWIQRHQYNPEQGFNLPAWCRKPVTALNLKDLCTRVIRLQDIPYDKLPVALISLIEMRD